MARKIILVAFVLVLASMSGVFAEEFTSGDYFFTIKDGTAEITGYKGLDGDLNIPSTVEHNRKTYRVTSIGWFGAKGRSNEVVTSVTIPDSVTSIGYGAFLWCTNLSSITIPDSVTSIGEKAFFQTSITSINISKNVTFMGTDLAGKGGIIEGERLRYINVDHNNPVYTQIDDVLFNKKEKQLHTYPSGKENETYVIPDGILSIAERAFYYSLLSSITIPNTVTSIGEYAFQSCYYLTSLTIPNSVTSIGSLAFNDCSSLESVVIPGSVTSIGDGAFQGLYDLELSVLEGSYAHEYAMGNGIYYSLITESEKGAKRIFWQEIGEKYCTVDNLRIRDGEGIENTSLFSLPSFTLVKVIDRGNEETIDGITANWVQVEMAEDTVSVQGDEIKKGTVGWCFGGYVSTTPEPIFP